MKVIVKNFGVIKTASLDLEKQVILFWQDYPQRNCFKQRKWQLK